jgi:hypothetical protein
MAINGHQWRPLTPLSERERGGGRERDGRQFPAWATNGRGRRGRAWGRARRGALTRGGTRPGGNGWEGEGEEGPRVGPACKREGGGKGAVGPLGPVSVRVSGFSFFSFLFYLKI